MVEGLVALERVRDWKALECQRHICEIQGALGAIAHPPSRRAIGATSVRSRESLARWNHKLHGHRGGCMLDGFRSRRALRRT